MLDLEPRASVFSQPVGRIFAIETSFSSQSFFDASKTIQMLETAIHVHDLDGGPE